MLAYAFWHWKQSAVPAAEYEARQVGFQAALAQFPPDGFFSATTVRLEGAPWAAQGRTAYQDWYVVRDMAALAPLNEAAVSGPRLEPHNAVARLAEDGTAGLYGLKVGTPLTRPAQAAWFGKPPGMSYAALFGILEPMVRSVPGGLWMRQMVLGPTPEFCLTSEAPIALPPSIDAKYLALAPVWPAPDP